ncbi:MAG: hypothetical protein JRN23_05155 [Nitrososphaerota archaeon]|nr:hypothetical protein [Nitrososphaerota archaeon]MDG6979449.1 hypothetical protein [Nitrososphaerota archaeon]MDG7021296.1 hypothetical protein [Nitrososphaerota archaeon]
MTLAVPLQEAKAAACGFCKRRLGVEYHFSCRACGATYCYIHMSRHERAACARRAARVAVPSANV